MYPRCTTIHISSNILAWLTTSYVTSSYQSFLDLLSTENNEVLYVWYARSCGMWGSDPLKVFHCVFLHVFKTSCWPFPCSGCLNKYYPQSYILTHVTKGNMITNSLPNNSNLVQFWSARSSIFEVLNWASLQISYAPIHHSTLLEHFFFKLVHL